MGWGNVGAELGSGQPMTGLIRGLCHEREPIGERLQVPPRQALETPMEEGRKICRSQRTLGEHGLQTSTK